jgi:catechol-2,3-dioxygenase
MGHSALVVKDLRESLRFYKDVLGCEAIWEGDDDWAQLGLGGDDLSLIQEGASEHKAHLGFQVNERQDLEQMHVALREEGVKIDPIKDHRDGTASFYFWDPSGNLLEALWDPRNTKRAK